VNYTPQQVSRIIGKTDINKSKSYKSGRKRQGYRSHEGYRVHKGIEGIVVMYIPATGSLHSDAFTQRALMAMNKIATTLNESGIHFQQSTIYANAFVVAQETKQ